MERVTDRRFDQAVESDKGSVLVLFWKPGCGHCRVLAAELEHVQEELGSCLRIFSMNVEENYQIAAELEISSLPALAFYRNGKFERFIGGLGRWNEIVKQLKPELEVQRKGPEETQTRLSESII